MKPDREAILARRALFVASALAQLVSSRAVGAQTEPECAPAKPPTSEEIAMARELFQEGVELSKVGQFEQALERLERAHEIVKNPKVLVAIAEIARSSEDWARALTHARRALACETELGTGRDRAVEIAEQAESRVARVAAKVNPAGATLELDGVSLEPGQPSEPVIVNPGRHILTARWPSGQTTSHSFEVAAGDTREIALDEPPPECLREPCVCLQPCLSPPITRRRSRLGAELGYTAFLDVVNEASENTGHGLSGRVFYELVASDGFVLELGLSVTPTLLADGALVPVGGDIALLVTPGPFVVGPRLTTGYAFSSDDGEPGERFVARSSFFLNPELVLGWALSENVVVGAQMGSFVSVQERDDDRALRMGWLTAGAFVSMAFGRACEEDGYPVRCVQETYDEALLRARR